MIYNATILQQAVGTVIKEHRRRLGMFQIDLAQDAGISRVHVANVEGGRHDLPLSRVVGICDALGLSVGDFMEQVIREARKQTETRETKKKKGGKP